MAAMLANQPIMQISHGEAMQLAMALDEVGRHYNIRLNGPYIALARLAAVAGMIYLPKMLQIQAAKKQARNNSVAQQPGAAEVFETVRKSGGMDYSGMSAAMAAEGTYNQ